MCKVQRATSRRKPSALLCSGFAKLFDPHPLEKQRSCTGRDTRESCRFDAQGVSGGVLVCRTTALGLGVALCSCALRGFARFDESGTHPPVDRYGFSVPPVITQFVSGLGAHAYLVACDTTMAVPGSKGKTLHIACMDGDIAAVQVK